MLARFSSSIKSTGRIRAKGRANRLAIVVSSKRTGIFRGGRNTLSPCRSPRGPADRVPRRSPDQGLSFATRTQPPAWGCKPRPPLNSSATYRLSAPRPGSSRARGDCRSCSCLHLNAPVGFISRGRQIERSLHEGEEVIFRCEILSFNGHFDR